MFSRIYLRKGIDLSGPSVIIISTFKTVLKERCTNKSERSHRKRDETGEGRWFLKWPDAPSQLSPIVRLASLLIAPPFIFYSYFTYRMRAPPSIFWVGGRD